MSLTTLGIILLVLAILFLIGWMFRSLVKFIIVIPLIYILFHIGFVWGFDEMNQMFHLDSILKPEVTEELSSKFDTLEEKREQFGVMETEEIKRVMDETLQTAWEKAGNTYDSIDKEALLNELEEKLASYSQEEIDQAVEQMDQEIKALQESTQ